MEKKAFLVADHLSTSWEPLNRLCIVPNYKYFIYYYRGKGITLYLDNGYGNITNILSRV